MAEKMHLDNCELTILMPCLNEAETLETCISKAKKFIKANNINGEVLIADNGSTDGSQDIAKENGAIVINVKEKGYGSALLGGINKANGKYIIMGDADDSYDFLKLEEFLSKLRQGFDVVMGNRFKGGIAPKAMPWLHKYIGNPILSYLGRLFLISLVKISIVGYAVLTEQK
ncbi:glycosyltransferase family 2 protein [Vibrio sp. M60_M31a]